MLKLINRNSNNQFPTLHKLTFKRLIASHTTTNDYKYTIPNYEKLTRRLDEVKKSWGLEEGLTLAEKILFAHLNTIETSRPKRGQDYLLLSPDRVAMQDASAQMALLQFMLTKKLTSAIPTSIHCDHLIKANLGAKSDLVDSQIENKEIFQFLKSCATKFGLEFWGPGSGIIHQIVLENYAAPGALMLGTDSHTPNAGGLGGLAIGVGGADAVDAMSSIPWELLTPKVLGVRLTGKLNGWTSPKDLILHLTGKLSGGTGYIIEYFGPGVQNLSCTGMATICNMGAEVGATTSVFPYTSGMFNYLQATNRSHLATVTSQLANSYLNADPQVYQDPGKYYDKVIEIDLDKLEPYINGPFTPDLSRPLSAFKKEIVENGWADQVKVGLIGSCTNSSYQDMSRAASVAEQASTLNLQLPKDTQFLITPGSEQIRATMERDQLTAKFEKLGGEVLANACGPCIGQWKRKDIDDGKPNAIVSSFNRNFKARNDGSAKTMNFLASPEIVTAMTLAGKLSFNPITDSLKTKDNKQVQLQPPTGNQLPTLGFIDGDLSYKPVARPQPQPQTPVLVSPTSDRLQVLEPFQPWDNQELTDLSVLIKVDGKCTTDHISAAGPWLKYKGHLHNIAKNTLIGAKSYRSDKVNQVQSIFTNEVMTIPDCAEQYLKNNKNWIVVTDFNYGEGSAREHAAMQPRYLGCKIVLARSLARIHETNLKKQGVLPLIFTNEKDYDLIDEQDELSTLNLKELSPGSNVTIKVTKQNGKVITIECKHTMSTNQIDWFRAGSALNFVAGNK